MTIDYATLFTVTQNSLNTHSFSFTKDNSYMKPNWKLCDFSHGFNYFHLMYRGNVVEPSALEFGAVWQNRDLHYLFSYSLFFYCFYKLFVILFNFFSVSALPCCWNWNCQSHIGIDVSVRFVWWINWLGDTTQSESWIWIWFCRFVSSMIKMSSVQEWTSNA